jgi:predicted negative regulator of RcsB-dependent stress response
VAYRIRKKGSTDQPATLPHPGTSSVSSNGSSGGRPLPGFLDDRKKNPLIVAGLVGLVALAGVGLVWHIYSDKKKKEQQAAALETRAEQMFSKNMQNKKADWASIDQLFEKVVKDYPDSSSAKVAPLFLASIQNQLAQPQKAVNWLHEGLEKNSGDTKILPFYYESLGVTFMSMKEYDQALAMFQKVTKFQGKTLADAAYYNIGKVYELLNQPALAILNYRKLQKKFPSSPWASEAEAYIKQQNPTASSPPPPLTPPPVTPAPSK